MKRKLYILILGFCAMLQAQAKMRIIGVDPVNGYVVIKNFYPIAINIHEYYISYNQTDTILGKLQILSGDTIMQPKSFLTVKIKGLNFAEGYLALHDVRYNSSIGVANGLSDYMQWGKAGHRYEDLADTTYFTQYNSATMKDDTIRRWNKGTYISTVAPYNFFGGSSDCGVKYWQSYKLPQLGIKIVQVVPATGVIGLRNIGGTNIDVSALILCHDSICIDSLAKMNIIKGNLDLSKNDTLFLSGFQLNDTLNNIALFFPISIKDTTNMIDFVQWGGYSGGYSGIAHIKGINDSNQYVVSLAKDTLYYIGNNNRTQYSSAFWKAYHYIADTTHQDTLGINDILKTNIQVYPNPAADQLTVDLGSDIQSMYTQIYLDDMQGRRRMSASVISSRVLFDTSKLSSGMYIITIDGVNIKSIKQKIYINH